MFVDVDIREVACGLWSAVYGKVFGRGNCEVVLRVIALQARDIRHAHAPGQERIFPVGLLPAAPSRIAKDVQVGRPEIKASHDACVTLAQVLHVLDATLHPDLRSHGVDAGGIKGRGQAHWLRILRHTFVNHAVQGLAPPLVGGDTEPWHRGRIVLHFGGLFRQRHAMHQVGGALLGSQLRVHERHACRVLRGGSGRCRLLTRSGQK